ncbi:hypothetical protein [Kitasatospora azatica]|nr:hypothetical protein [Kitasatospora azatica]
MSAFRAQLAADPVIAVVRATLAEGGIRWAELTRRARTFTEKLAARRT